jgi:hypothetical protein
MIKFGDLHLINKIRREEKLKKSKDWQVSIRITGEEDVVVKGIEDKEEAMDKAYDKGFDSIISNSEVEVLSARKIAIDEKEEVNENQLSLFKTLNQK